MSGDKLRIGYPNQLISLSYPTRYLRSSGEVLEIHDTAVHQRNVEGLKWDSNSTALAVMESVDAMGHLVRKLPPPKPTRISQIIRIIGKEAHSE